MNKLITLVTDIVATYRLTKLILDDKLTEDLRNMVWEKFPRDSKMSYFFTCPWCISIWAGAAVFALRKANPELANFVSGSLAASAVTGHVYTKIG